MLHDHHRSSPFVSIHERTHDGSTLHVYGEVDISTAQQLEADINAAIIDDESILHVNFEECQYIDSSALAVLVRTRKRLAQRVRISVGENASILRILSVSGLDALLLDRHSPGPPAHAVRAHLTGDYRRPDLQLIEKPS